MLIKKADKEKLQALLADEIEKRKLKHDKWKAKLDLRKAEVNLHQTHSDEDIEYLSCVSWNITGCLKKINFMINMKSP